MKKPLILKSHGDTKKTPQAGQTLRLPNLGKAPDWLRAATLTSMWCADDLEFVDSHGVDVLLPDDERCTA